MTVSDGVWKTWTSNTTTTNDVPVYINFEDGERYVNVKSAGSESAIWDMQYTNNSDNLELVSIHMYVNGTNSGLTVYKLKNGKRYAIDQGYGRYEGHRVSVLVGPGETIGLLGLNGDIWRGMQKKEDGRIIYWSSSSNYYFIGEIMSNGATYPFFVQTII